MDVASIVENAAKDAGYLDNGGDEVVDTGGGYDDTPAETADSSDDTAEVASDDPAPETPAVAAPETSEEDELKAIEAELTTKTPALNKGKLSVSRHQAVLTRERKKHEAALKEIQDRYAQYEDPQVKQRLAAFQLAETDHEVFFNRLIQHPKFQPLVERLTKAQQADLAKSEAAKPVTAAELVEPKPDYLNADGTLGYTAEGAKALAEYKTALVRSELQAEIARLTGQVAPILRERQAVEQLGQMREAVAPVLASARRWQGFTEHEADINAYMSRPEFNGLSAAQALEKAYDAVVPPRLKLAEETKAAEAKAAWVKELQDRNKTRGVVSPNGAPAATGKAGPLSVEDIVRAAAMRLQEAEV